MTEAKSSSCTKTFTYNGENRMTGMTVSDGTNTNSWTYSYDADGERTVKKNNTTGTYTVYWFDNYEETYKTSGTSVALTESVKYYKANDGTVAQRVTDKTKTSENEKLTYLFKDVLGSTVKVCDENGNVTEFLGYEPFGKLVMRKVPGSDGNLVDGDTKEPVSKKTYTGQEPETDDGLYYYHARYYDSSIGRFIQADSVLDGLNRYCYCGNNPVNFCDPSGQKAIYFKINHMQNISGNIPHTNTPFSKAGCTFAVMTGIIDHYRENHGMEKINWNDKLKNNELDKYFVTQTEVDNKETTGKVGDLKRDKLLSDFSGGKLGVIKDVAGDAVNKVIEDSINDVKDLYIVIRAEVDCGSQGKGEHEVGLVGEKEDKKTLETVGSSNYDATRTYKKQETGEVGEAERVITIGENK